MVKSISILGCTGSIGRQTIAVAEHIGMPVAALTANRKIDMLEEQARRLHPKFVAVYDEAAAKQRIASQMSDDEKKPFADVIIDNSGDIERLYEMTDRLYRQALEKDGSNQRQTGGAEKKPSQKEKA